MKLQTALYLEQNQVWPREGRHILAQFDADSVVVYQAYRPAIGHFAASKGYFGGEFNLSRMSWFKPNFLWMMVRCGWGTKAEQEVTLVVRIRREFFDFVLSEAVPSSYDADSYDSAEAWKQAVGGSRVRLQWDPDHAPSGGSLQRRAIQLGLRGEVLQSYAHDEIIEIEDISNFVAAQCPNARPENYDRLLTPVERIY